MPGYLATVYSLECHNVRNLPTLMDINVGPGAEMDISGDQIGVGADMDIGSLAKCSCVVNTTRSVWGM